MIVLQILGSILALSFFFMLWGLPLLAVTSAIYFIIARCRIGKAINPFVLFDAFMPVVVPLVWCAVSLFFSNHTKSLANILEIFWLGLLWSISVALRTVLICWSKRRNNQVVYIANFAIIAIAVLSALFVPTVSE